MKVRYIGESEPLELIHGKIYETLAVEDGWYRIIDETGEDYLYPPEAFELIYSTQTVHCHDCGKRLVGAGVTVITGTDTGERRQV